MKRGGPLKRTTHLAQRSKKTATRYVARRELVARLLAERPVCEVQVLCSGARAVDVHERLKRSRGGDILDPVQAHMVTACRMCHGWTELEPREAGRRWLLIPSWHVCPPIGPC